MELVLVFISPMSFDRSGRPRPSSFVSILVLILVLISGMTRLLIATANSGMFTSAAPRSPIFIPSSIWSKVLAKLLSVRTVPGVTTKSSVSAGLDVKEFANTKVLF